MRPCATDGAPSNLWWQAAPWSPGGCLGPCQHVRQRRVALHSQRLALTPSGGTEWQHQSDSVTTLPSGAVFDTNQRAEHGDGLAPFKSALVLGEARETHLRDYHSAPFEHKGLCDEWLVDDGQCFVRPRAFDGWLRALDAALATFGATQRLRCTRQCQELCPAPLPT